ncbi:MAG TPA: hypothetical protein VGC22_14285 [Chitinophaga sp.]
MNRFTTLATIMLLACFTSAALGQKLKVTEGDLAVLKGQKAINTQFTYDNMSVGKFPKEEDYIKSKTEDYNKKEPGRGDTWAKGWVSDRVGRFEPQFNELFTKASGLQSGTQKDAKYTLIFHTTSTEPGFNVGVWRKNASIDGEAIIVETADPSKVVARITVENAPGRVFMGNDYDTGERIQEAYAMAGRSIGRLIAKKVN